MQLVLERPFSFPTLTDICDLIKGIFLDEADDDKSIIRDLDEPHDKDEPVEGDEDDFLDDRDSTIIAGGEKSPPEDGDKDEDEGNDKEKKGKPEDRDKAYQTIHQETMAKVKKYNPDLYRHLKDGTEPESHTVNIDETEDLSQADLAKVIVKETSASVLAELRKDQHGKDLKAAEERWDEEAAEARTAIKQAQKALGLTDAQAKEAFAYAKDLGLETPMRIASVAMTQMRIMSPGEPRTTNERLAEAKRQRDLILADQPTKTSTDPQKRKKTAKDTILDEMRAIRPKDAGDLLDSRRRRKK